MTAALALLLAAGCARALPPAATAYAIVDTTGPAVSSITVRSLDVFDLRVPGEDIWPFRIANKIHVQTREHVIRRELLLQPGEEWSARKAIESERNLRANGSFRFAEISSAPAAGGQATGVTVLTQDAWTTNVRFSVGTEGGDTFLAWGAEERNLFGLNKQAGFTHSERGSRLRNDARYTDPRLAGSRFRLSSMYARTSRGDSFGADLTRPFFSLDTPAAMGVGWTRFLEERVLYRDSEDWSKFTEQSRMAQLSVGRRLPWDDLFVQRAELGWYSSKHSFFSDPGTVAGTLPRDRELSGPTLGYSWVRPRYIKETYINSMERVEDFNLGNELALQGGFMGAALGSDRDRWTFHATDQQGYRLGDGRFALAQGGISGRVANGKWDNGLLYGNLNLFWRTDWPLGSTWVSHMEGSQGRMLDREHQVILGGDSGLRGYKNNSFTGGRAALWNLENRFFFPGEHFHLFRFGGAVFFDAGSVVPEGSGFSFKRFKMDVGAGLRFVPTRSRSGGAFRMDFAYALNGGPGGRRFVVAIKGGQAFQIFNSSARRVGTTPQSRLNEIAPPQFPEVE